MAKKKSSLTKIISVLLVLALIGGALFYEFVINSNGSGDISEAVFSVHVIDVGQGDSILVRSGDKTMLIDAGPKSAKNEVERYLKQNEITKLDYVIATHPHEDHIGGMEHILERFEYETVIMPNVTHTSQTYLSLLEKIDADNKGITEAKSGDVYTLGEATFKILAPNSDKYVEKNDYSVVIKLTFKGKSFILSGDAEKISENEMVQKYGKELNCDVYKVGHHGSDSSTDEIFLAMMSPKYAVVSCGRENMYKHPSEKVVKRIRSSGATLYQTFEDGTVIFFITENGALNVTTKGSESV